MRSVNMCWLLALLVLSPGALAALSIDQFGAVRDTPTLAAATTNAAALVKLMQAVNGSSSSNDRVGVIPPDHTYYILNATISGLYDVTLQVDGHLVAHKNISEWSAHTRAVLYILDSHSITIQGQGSIDGQGYDWWWYVILTGKDDRPHMLVMRECTDVTLRQFTMRNSAQFHALLEDVRDVVVRDITIHVDVEEQKNMLRQQGLLRVQGGISIPTFPLNTDGVDPSGRNILIENVTITNFDDAVAVKPMNGNGRFSTCSQNITVRNARVNFGVGMTIGSVPPNDAVNCVRDVTFEDVYFTNALKAIYIKSNPGDHGTGIIDNIVYRNIYVASTVWMPLWIGPQQQQQPGSAGTGCSFLYPIVDKCPTQPRVAMSNFLLSNVTFENSYLLPGVILCDAQTPCDAITFDNVTNKGLMLVRKDYVCKNVKNGQFDSVPAVACV